MNNSQTTSRPLQVGDRVNQRISLSHLQDILQSLADTDGMVVESVDTIIHRVNKEI